MVRGPCTVTVTVTAPEAVLQTGAAYLSDDGRDEEFWENRPLGRVAGSGWLGRQRRVVA